MINIFQIPADDQSIFFLGQIFGNVGTVLPIRGDAPIILGVMFKTFNTIVLTVGALIVLYITVMGVMATAHEGEFLGKKWHKLWTPIRTLLGIATLVPTAGGYSVIQIVMLWIIVQGIGAADFIWTTTLKTIDVAGSVTANPAIPVVGVNNSMKTLFQAITCDQAARARYPSPVGAPRQGAYYCTSNGGSQFCQVTSNFNPSGDSVFNLGPNGRCGVMSFCNTATSCADPDSIKCAACKAQHDALVQNVQQLNAIGKMFVDTDYQYRIFYATSWNTKVPMRPAPWISKYCADKGIGTSKCCVPSATGEGGCLGNPGDFPNPTNFAVGPSEGAVKFMWKYAIMPQTGNTNFLTANTNLYVATVAAAVTDKISQIATTKSDMQDPRLVEAQKFGWIYAGAYYYAIAQKNNNNLTEANPAFTMSGEDPAVTSEANELTEYRINYGAAGQLTDAAAISVTQSTGGADFTSSIPTALAPLTDSFKTVTGNIMRDFQKYVSGASDPTKMATNPLSALQSFGYGLLVTIQIFFVVALVVAFIAAILGYLNVFVIGTGIVNPIGPTLSTLMLILVPLMMAFMAAFFVIGGTLAIYVPLIPYIIFTVGVIGWLIAVIEAMVAAPIVALGILGPGGQHELLGRAEPAMMLIFAIFLRPGLMIFGLIAAMLLSIVVVTMINSGFNMVMSSILTYPGLIETFLFIAAYVMLVVTALNKSFALIYIIPDGVMRWIGGQAPGYGGAQDVGEATGQVKGGIEGGASGAASAGRGAVDTTKGAGAGLRQDKIEGQQAKDKVEGDKKAEGGPPNKPQ